MTQTEGGALEFTEAKEKKLEFTFFRSQEANYERSPFDLDNQRTTKQNKNQFIIFFIS